MKTITIIGVVSMLTLGLITSTFASTVKVKGYTKKNGTYVQPSYKTSPNKTKLDNYSTKGNYNPYSGKTGKTKDVLGL